MRSLHATVALLALALGLCAPSTAAAQYWDEDDFPLDDPKLARFERHPELRTLRVPDAETFTPSVKFAYRRLTALNLDKSDLVFNSLSLTLYGISSRWIRLATEAEFGFGAGGPKDQYSAYYFTTGIDLGVQYPWRVTPFVDARFAGGLIGGRVVGRSLLSYTYMYGVDVGVELYVVDRLFVTLAVGWVHPFYKGADLAFEAAHPNSDPLFKDFETDSFTFKIGVGL